MVRTRSGMLTPLRENTTLILSPIIVEVRDNARKALPDRISGHCVKPPLWGLVYKRRGGLVFTGPQKSPHTGFKCRGLLNISGVIGNAN